MNESGLAVANPLSFMGSPYPYFARMYSHTTLLPASYWLDHSNCDISISRPPPDRRSVEVSKPENAV